MGPHHRCTHNDDYDEYRQLLEDLREPDPDFADQHERQELNRLYTKKTKPYREHTD